MNTAPRLHERFAVTARRTPHAIALRCGERALSYAELDARANRLANALLAAGIAPGARVAIYAERSIEVIVSILGTLKAGAAYLPIDPEYPGERVDEVIADAGVAAFFTQRGFLSRLKHPPTLTVCVDDGFDEFLASNSSAPDIAGSVDDDIYVIYTSGSTGKPKGARVRHSGVLNLYDWYIGAMGVGEGSRFTIFTSLGFDLTQTNLWVPLLAGGSVTLLDVPHFDAGRILATIERDGITHLNCTPSAFYGLIDDGDARTWAQLASLKLVALGGETTRLARIQTWRDNPQNTADFVNRFGPTECSAVVATYRVPRSEPLPLPGPLPIGFPIANTNLYVLDEQMQRVPQGEEGELYVGGAGVGGGYLNRPELTAERFVKSPFVDGETLYRTGDRARQSADGATEFLGRLDFQVKVRGYRIELPEIEAVLMKHPAVREAVVMAREDAREGLRLAAYLTLQTGADADLHALREHARAALPDYMLPASWTFLPAFPLNTNGKVDRKALPEPSAARPPLAAAYAPPAGPLEAHVATQWQELLAIDRIGRDDPFFELGGTSLAAIRFVGRVNRLLGIELPMVDFFAASTVRGYAAHLAATQSDAVAKHFGAAALGTEAANTAPIARRARSGEREDIALVGMSVRVAGAADVEAFWDMLVEGRDGLVELSDADLDEAGVPAEVRSDSDYVRRAMPLADAECFDAAFFGIPPREAALMDPQQRLLLEGAWSALEHAGYDPSGVQGRVGVFAGVARNSYFGVNLATNPQTRAQLGEVQITYVNDKDYAATRISHKLSLKGPALTAQTACSTGGVLLHLARQSLLAGECDVALVGGARVMSPQKAGYPWIDGSIFSRDGRMRVFDAKGSGMIRSSGVVVLAVKRRSDAEAAGDTIYALLKGSALNNDGSDKVGYTAPSVPGQAEVIAMALADADVGAETISYVEAHGTGTHLGDPIEIAALTRAYRQHTSEKGYCRIGSVKSNVGHLDPAAPLAGIAKVALALRAGKLPASLHYENPNPQIDFAGSPFVVNGSLTDWPASPTAPRRAGVSAFGIGGTNAHLIFEEAPAATAPAAIGRSWQLLPFSAKTPEALKQGGANLAQAVARSAINLDDAAWTLQTGRARLEKRAFVVARDAAQGATRFADPKQWTEGSPQAAARVVFLFPGQGAQHPNMGRDLYDGEALFRSIIDDGCAILQPLLGLDLRNVLYPDAAGSAEAAEQLKQTGLAQPAIYLISYATARLWQSWGVQPVAMVGHSVGEYVAATLAGVFTFADALKVLAARAKLMQSMPAGSMLAVRLPEDETRALLPASTSIAALNAPKLTIVSGPTPVIDEFETSLRTAEKGVMRLHTSHAFHSEMMEPVLERFAAEVASVPRSTPMLPILSTRTGGWLSAEEAIDPNYWARQLREPVRYAPAIAALLGDASRGGNVLLEVGPGQSLSGATRQIAATVPAAKASVIASLQPAAQEDASAAEFMATALGRLWLAGVEPNWAAVQGVPRRRIGLPAYPFARTRHWIEPGRLDGAATVPADVSAAVAASTTASAAASQVPEPPSLAKRIAEIITAVTGIEIPAEQTASSFLELGMDSLVLTQLAGKLKNAFRTELRFRQLMEDLSSVDKLAAHLAALGICGDAASASGSVTSSDASAPADDGKPKKAFGAATKISKVRDQLSPSQRRALGALIERTVKRTGKSKSTAQVHRAYFADPRTVSGFKPMWKEIVYPIVSTRSEGAYVWDVDGNRYIDTINGFGATFFGHQPKFVNEAVTAQLKDGYEIGPMQHFLGECAERFTRMVKLDRVTFCNTGSEAVSAAQRCARTVTGKDLIASFVNDYHGVHDEVIVRPGPGGRGFPAASGIPASHTANTLILDYGDPKSLEILRARADDLAAIMVEPIQSRNQSLKPREFLHGCRELASQAGFAFIMDEVITGFRLSQGGAQDYFGVKADLATYGKVFGGGMPIGAVAGVPKFMDALDGGFWQFGDDSVPEVGVTYFAGTFVRHPLSMAAVLACLRHMEANPHLQAETNARIEAFVDRLRAAIVELAAPLRVSNYTSIFRFEFTQDEPFGELLAHYFRERGVHTYDGRNQVMTTEHTDAVLDALYAAYVGGIRQMQADGLLGRVGSPTRLGLADTRPGAIWYEPPMVGARLGRDAQGLPRWYVPDAARAGHWLQVEDAA